MGSTTVDASTAPTPAKADVVEALKTSRAYGKLTIPPMPNVAQLDVWMLSVSSALALSGGYSDDAEYAW
eukprot:10952473-Lingulodinium_polyedra.AAC.1